VIIDPINQTSMRVGSRVQLIIDIPFEHAKVFIGNSLPIPSTEHTYIISSLVRSPVIRNFKRGISLKEYPSWLMFNADHWRELDEVEVKEMEGELVGDFDQN
jgi:hypothetical protein